MGPDLSATDDVALVHLVARGDEAAMGEIYHRHGRGVYGLARRVLGDAAVAEEVLQDVFVRLWQRPDRFDPARGHLKGYLLREGHGRAVDRLRSDTARRAREARHEVEKERFQRPADIEREVWDLIRSEKVKEALEQLSPRERDAITLAYFGGHTYRDVARILEEPEGTIKGRIRLGLQKLASALEASGMGVAKP